MECFRNAALHLPLIPDFIVFVFISNENRDKMEVCFSGLVATKKCARNARAISNFKKKETTCGPTAWLFLKETAQQFIRGSFAYNMNNNKLPWRLF